jgi:hypothetical protein
VLGHAHSLLMREGGESAEPAEAAMQRIFRSHSSRMDRVEGARPGGGLRRCDESAGWTELPGLLVRMLELGPIGPVPFAFRASSCEVFFFR